MLKHKINTISLFILLLLNFSCCDCFQDCGEDWVVLKFDNDSKYGYAANELDTVYFFRLNKTDNTKIDSFCCFNQEYNLPGTEDFFFSTKAIALHNNGYNYLIRTKDRHDYLISDISIDIDYSKNTCTSCANWVKRLFKINGQQYIDREIYTGDFFADKYIYLKK